MSDRFGKLSSGAVKPEAVLKAEHEAAMAGVAYIWWLDSVHYKPGDDFYLNDLRKNVANMRQEYAKWNKSVK